MTDLRDLLLSLDDGPPTPDPVGAVRRRLRRRARLQVAAAAAATLAVAGVATQVAGGSPTAAPGEVATAPGSEPIAVVPFMPVPAVGCCEGYPPRGPVPTCEVADLAVTATARAGAPATQLEVVFRNDGKVACDVPFAGDLALLSVSTSPTVSLGSDKGGGSGGTLTAGVAVGDVGSSRLALRRPPPAVPPGGSVVMAGSWRRPCEPSGPATANRVRLELVHPKGAPYAPIEVPLVDAPASACVKDVVVLGGGAVGLYDYTVLDAEGRVEGEPTKSLVASLVDLPDTVERGELLRFGVRFDNPTRGDITLRDGCPNFAITLAAPGVSSRPLEDSQLNCDAAPAAVPAGRGVVFLMEVRVAQGAATRTLTWTRTDQGYAGLSADIIVTAPADPAKVTVLLYHCGVQPLSYDGQEWEVVRPPFDATNAPSAFTGAGTVERVGDELRYTDDRGARLTFTVGDGVPNGVCA